MVIDDDDRDFLAQPVEGFEQLLHYGWSKTLEGLIEQQYAYVARQRAGHRNHLLFASRKIIRGAVEPLPDPREIFIDSFPRPMHAVAGLALQPAKFKVLLDAHAREQAAPLRHVADTKPRVLRRRIADKLAVGEFDRSVRRWRDADQRFQEG